MIDQFIIPNGFRFNKLNGFKIQNIHTRTNNKIYRSTYFIFILLSITIYLRCRIKK
jgi:hypothetical protein